MALATQCPHCHTTFRVAHDQLKLRAGLVRCGACKQIFNGIENLLRPDEAERTLAPVPPQVEPPPPPVEETPAIDHLPDEPQIEPPASAEVEDVAPAMEAVPPGDGETGQEQLAPGEYVSDDPLQRMTLMDFSPAAPAGIEHSSKDAAAPDSGLADELDALEKAIDDLQHQPWRAPAEEAAQPVESDELDQADDNAYEEPAFVKHGRRRERAHRVMRMLMAVGMPMLLLGVLMQGIYIFRNQLAAWFPEAKPALVGACHLLGCQVGLPAQIEAVAIESSELQAATTDQRTFGLSVLLGNHSAIVQAWPNIELTLNDADDKPIARRVFVPRDYLPATQEVDKGFAPKSEQAIKLYFALSQLKASGYRVYLFYP
ncbi:MAG TPA: DUF3426 domain-containing protein [Noviherbaspirillum sp.]|nr:DUF3426 domain-containing protein [Noviherbaspirillum sp.]